MYHSDWIIQHIQAEKLMALQLENALSGVKDQVLQQARKISDGATRLLFYTSCFTENYQDVCARLKAEDLRFAEGIQQLIKDRNIIFSMVRIYIDLLFKNKTAQQLEYIKKQLMKAGVNVSTSSLTNQTFAFGVTTSVCLGVGMNSNFIKSIRTGSTLTVMGLGFYGYVQKASESAERLRLLSPLYYHAIFLKKLDMMYFLIEPLFMRARVFGTNLFSDDDVVNSIINMVK